MTLAEQNTEIKRRVLRFRMALYHLGIDLTEKQYDSLVETGLINASSKIREEKRKINLVQANYAEKHHFQNDSVLIQKDEEWITVTDTNAPDVEELLQNVGGVSEISIKQFENLTTTTYRKDIQKKDWYLEDKTNPPQEFVDWINSIRSGWQNKIEYKPFNLYREQAYSWLNDAKEFDSNATEDVQLDFVITERRKCIENGIYAVNRYGIIKDEEHPLGEIKAIAWEVQEFLLYLLDIGLSALIGKPRQIGSTTVILLRELLNVMMMRNRYCKFVAQKGKKTEEIFEHKCKFPFERMVPFIKPSFANYNKTTITFKYQSGKGTATASTSMFEVCETSADVVNAGTPQVTLLDEIGLNELVSEIIDNGRPTLFRFNPDTGKLEIKRQIFGWGTADASSPEFEYVYKSARDAWNNKDYRYGIVPIFINAFAKPGFTKEFYESEKLYYYGKKKKPGKPDPKTMFHQTYPIVEEDMFLSGSDTIIPLTVIKKKKESIINFTDRGDIKPKYGYFEPVYDTSIKIEDSDVPFRIIGARFIPANEEQILEDSEYASVCIFKEPVPNWVNRYYKGTDPIYSSSGHSKMSSVVYDGVAKYFPAKFLYRHQDYRFCYLQSLLLNLYYSSIRNGKAIGIKELLEINVGGEYKNYVDDKKYGSILISNTMLPEQFQTTTIDVGIRKQGNNSKNLITKLEEVLSNYSGKIHSVEFWNQLETFVKKQGKTGFSYEPKDRRYHYDDEIDGTVFAKLAHECYSHLKPYCTTEQEQKKKQMSRLRYKYDANYNLILA